MLFIHCPPHTPGSKNGTTRNGAAVAPASAARKSVAAHRAGGVERGVAVDEQVDPVEEGALVPVGGAPLDEEAALVLAQDIEVAVVRAPVRGAGAHPLLDLPAGDVDEDERVRAAPGREVGAPADEHGGAGALLDPALERGEAVGVVELVDGEVAHDAEDAVVGEVAGDERVDDLEVGGGRILDVDDLGVGQHLADAGGDRRDIPAGVHVHRDERMPRRRDAMSIAAFHASSPTSTSLPSGRGTVGSFT